MRFYEYGTSAQGEKKQQKNLHEQAARQTMMGAKNQRGLGNTVSYIVGAKAAIGVDKVLHGGMGFNQIRYEQELQWYALLKKVPEEAIH